ncbi:AI-2E family transporter [Halorarius litoreus]|uniref:AI-2E family transporter n=1 Tax=Halorarius litoreus TaxID=2962676 RepID=UPI0020CC85CB|nr:AI-2E family transporter [Halorarius litoreus]
MRLSDVNRGRAVWWTVGAVLAATLLFVAYSFVGTLVFAVFLYYATRPVYKRFKRRIRPASLAAAAALFAVALPVLVLLAYAIAIGLQEFGRAATRVELGPFESALGPYVDVSKIVENPSGLLDDPNLVDTLQGVADSALVYGGFIGNGLLHAFVMFAIAFYLLRDGPRLSRWAQGQFADSQGVLVAYGRAVDRDLYKVFSGNILNAIFTAAIGAIVYSVLNFFAPAGSAIPYPALVGLLAGAASLIPVVGMKLVYFPVGIYLFAAEYLSAEPVYWFPVAFAALSFVVVDTIPDLILRPYVSGRNLHVGMVMFAYIFGPLLFGWYGIFLGPIILVFVVHFVRLVLPELIEGTEIKPFAVDPATITELPMEMEGPPESTSSSEESASGHLTDD